MGIIAASVDQRKQRLKALMRAEAGRGRSDDVVTRNRCGALMGNKEAFLPPGDAVAEKVLEAIAFDAAGLVAAIAQRHDTGEVLMLAWMNRDSVRETLATGRVTYWSRSRRALWRKGETSGHVQILVAMRIDCDGDALLLSVDQTGPACHTNRSNCFFRLVTADGLMITDQPAEPG
jgi:phosphoribosyl-AMP cyclohydrolase